MNKQQYQLFFLILAAIILTIVQGCSMTKNINTPGQLNFEQQADSVPMNIAVYISDTSRSEVIEGEEGNSFFTTYYKSNIGKSLESNVIKAFDQIFNDVILIGNKVDIPKNFDALIEIQFESSSWEAESTVGGFNRNFIIDLKGIVFNKEGKIVKEHLATGTTKCEVWKCFSGDSVEGEDTGTVLLKSLFIPFYSYTTEARLSALLEKALSATLKQAINNLSEKLINDKPFLATLSYEYKSSVDDKE